MITCSVCNKENHHLAINCSSCGGYLQNRVDNLDLFLTAWNVLEKPKKAFYTIAVAKHKNYGLILAAIAGIALTFFIFWIIKAGEYTNSLLNFLAAGFTVGPLFGILSVSIISLIVIIVSRITGKKIKYRNVFAIIAYAQIPIIISAILILPIEIMSFGLFFFTANPSPNQLKPFSYTMLLGLDGIFLFWTLVLLYIGFKKMIDCSAWYALMIEIVALSIYIGIIIGCLQWILPVIK